MNFSRHQKQHLRQVMRNLANLLSAAGRKWRDVKVREHHHHHPPASPLLPSTHTSSLPVHTPAQCRTPRAHLLKETRRGEPPSRTLGGHASHEGPNLEAFQPSLQDRNQSQPIPLLWPRLPQAPIPVGFHGTTHPLHGRNQSPESFSSTCP